MVAAIVQTGAAGVLPEWKIAGATLPRILVARLNLLGYCGDEGMAIERVELVDE